jgi:hypothetical protein
MVLTRVVQQTMTIMRKIGMTNIIHSNDTYDVVVGTGTHNPDVSFDLYKIVNKETKVVELEVSVICKAIEYADQLDTAYKNVVAGNPSTGFDFSQLFNSLSEEDGPKSH